MGEWDGRVVVAPDGYEVHVRETGAGEPLVLVHGAACDGHFFDETAQILAARRRVVVPDRRGYGRNAPGVRYQGIEELCATNAADLAAVVESLGTGPVDVAGHSTGALVSLHLAERRPDLVRRMVCHEPPLAALIPRDDPIYEFTARIEAEKGGLFFAAYCDYLQSMGEADDRAREATVEEADRAVENGERYFATESQWLYDAAARVPEVPAEVPLVFAYGERSREGHCAQSTCRAAELGGRLAVPFAGGHNAARELPGAFAASVLGTLELLCEPTCEGGCPAEP